MLALAVPPSLLLSSLRKANTFGCHVTICGRSWQTRSCEVTLPLSWFLFRVNSLVRSLSSIFICFNLFFGDFLFFSFTFGTVFCKRRELNLLDFLPFLPFICVSPSFILLFCYYFSAAHGLLLLLFFALHTLTFHGYRFVDCDFFFCYLPLFCYASQARTYTLGLSAYLFLCALRLYLFSSL